MLDDQLCQSVRLHSLQSKLNASFPMKNNESAAEQLDRNYSISAFVLKTFNILNDPQNASSIAWCADGNSFTIKNLASFTQKILPVYFRHHKYESFVRQLNMYNFCKIKNSPERNFSNKYFMRDHEDLLKFIKRKAEKKNRIISLSNLPMEQEKENTPNFPSLKEILILDIPQPQDIKDTCEDIMQPEPAPKTRRVHFNDSAKELADENYETLIAASSKWLNRKSDDCWSKIKSDNSFASFRISLQVIDHNTDRNEQSQRVVLHERRAKHKTSILLQGLPDFSPLQQ